MVDCGGGHGLFLPAYIFCVLSVMKIVLIVCNEAYVMEVMEILFILMILIIKNNIFLGIPWYNYIPLPGHIYHIYQGIPFVLLRSTYFFCDL